MKKLIISLSFILLTIILSFLVPEGMPINNFDYNVHLSFVLGIICSFVIGSLFLLKYVVWLLQNTFPSLGRKQAITHSMAIFSFFLGTLFFIKFHHGNYKNLEWYQHYYLIFPLSSYLMSLLVIILHPIRSFKEISSSEENEE